MRMPLLKTNYHLLAIGAGALLTASVLAAPPAQAAPCPGATTPWGGGSWCDWDFWPDGSFMHAETFTLFGYGGTNPGFRACPAPGGRVPTDYDPNTPCPR